MPARGFSRRRLPCFRRPPWPADVTGRVETHTAPRTSASQAIVYAEPVDRPAPARPVTPRLLQRTKPSYPAVMVVPVGSTVDFPNQDDIFHNVFSLSAPAPFDLGLYRAGATKKRTFAQPGTYRVFCNIHPQMTAFIVVVPTPYMAPWDDGRYSLDLPPGPIASPRGRIAPRRRP